MTRQIQYGSSSNTTHRILQFPSTRAAGSGRTVVFTAAGLLGAGVLLIGYDMAVVRAIHTQDFSESFRRHFDNVAPIGNLTGVSIILLTLTAANRESWRRFARIALAVATANALAATLKAVVVRQKPIALIEQGVAFGSGPSLNVQAAFDASLQSFPSSQAAIAAGFAISLAMMYPQARYCFYGFAALCCLQCVLAGQHFPSDTLIGATIGCTAVWGCYHSRFAKTLIDQWEQRTEGSRESPSKEKRYSRAA